MASRREILVGGGGFAALGLGLAARRVEAAAPLYRASGAAVFLIDTALPGASGAIAAAELAGAPVARFAGDVGTAWFDHLDPLWRQGPSAIAGVTRGGAFFCVERLARNHRLACVFRSLLPRPDARSVAAAAGMALARAGRAGGGGGPPGEWVPGKTDHLAVAWSLRPVAGRRPV